MLLQENAIPISKGILDVHKSDVHAEIEQDPIQEGRSDATLLEINKKHYLQINSKEEGKHVLLLGHCKDIPMLGPVTCCHGLKGGKS